MSRVTFSQHCDFHGDLKVGVRARFTQNEQGWATQADLERDFVTDPPFKSAEKWIPIGVSEHFAMGFGTSLAPAHRQRAKLVEQDQFAKVWINTLLRCHFRPQYDAIHKRFLEVLKKDPSLKMAAEIVFRCEFLNKFRDELPEERKEDAPIGLNNAIAARADGIYQTGTFDGITGPSELEPLENPQKVGLYVFRYRDQTNPWKLAMKFHCQNDTLPTAHLAANGHLYVAYYVSDECVKMIHFDETQKEVESWYTPKTGLKGPLTCDVDVVTDGHAVYEKNGTKHWFEDRQIITSVRRAESNLYIGTFSGHVYNVTDKTFVKTRDPLAVLNIGTSGPKYIMQTINDVTFDERLLNVGRVLCSAVKGTIVISLTKYGVIQMSFMGANSFYPAPEGVTCELDHLLPYYKDGIWISEDASAFAVMYPDGRVVFKQLGLVK